jgi:hypothetical protein
MKKVYGITVALGLAMGVAWWGGVGRAQQDGAGEKAGEKLDEIGRKIKKGLDKAEGAVREGVRSAALGQGAAFERPERQGRGRRGDHQRERADRRGQVQGRAPGRRDLRGHESDRRTDDPRLAGG